VTALVAFLLWPSWIGLYAIGGVLTAAALVLFMDRDVRPRPRFREQAVVAVVGFLLWPILLLAIAFARMTDGKGRS